MNKKFVFVGLLVVFVLSLMVGAVSAQGGGGRGQGGGRGGGDRPNGDGLRDIVQVVVDATGLDPQDLMQQLRDGAILADIITANGGDVNAVIAEALVVVTERTNQAVTDGKITQAQADDILANAETRITELINNPIPEGGRGEGRGGDVREAIQAVVDATGLEAEAIMQQLREGATLAEIIVANDGDVDSIIAILIGLVTEKTNQAVTDGVITQERADEILANAETHITNLLNNPLPEGGMGGNHREFERVFMDALEGAGLTREEIRTQLQNGVSLRQVLTDAGLDVEALTAEALANAQTRLDEAVANETLTAEEAATRLVEIETRINEALDKIRTAPNTDV
ncbi:MAG: hypothetical protein SFZ02_11580 [bacterium]|nr:hypothetical protein [bacterium]